MQRIRLVVSNSSSVSLRAAGHPLGCQNLDVAGADLEGLSPLGKYRCDGDLIGSHLGRLILRVLGIIRHQQEGSLAIA